MEKKDKGHPITRHAD